MGLHQNYECEDLASHKLHLLRLWRCMVYMSLFEDLMGLIV
jgi:hypothetical protein